MAIFDFSTHWWLITALATSTVLLYRHSRKGRSIYPPGPRKWPIIGNMFSIPEEKPWVTFKKWSKEYGSDIISLEVLGSHIVILNSHTVVRDLMEKRSLNYSDRPRMPMLNELQGWTWNFGFMRYGPEWKGLVVISTAYGIDVQPRDDPYVKIGNMTQSALAKAGNIGTYLVDFIPSLQYLPDWFPGAGFKKEAKESSKWVTLLPDAGFQVAKKNYLAGTGNYCIATRALDGMRDDPNREHKEKVLRNALGVFYAAGSDTTASSISSFVLAMVLNPETQQKLRSAIETIVGTDRLPEFEDVDPIAYLHATVKETLRWQPVLPLAIAHGATEDDVYNGYYIPKGAAVIGNAWALLQDENIFGPDTDKFKPERFLTPDGRLNPAIPNPDMAFGFGRRICAGRIIAYSSMMITCASLVHCFDITKAKDSDGQEITPKVEYTTGLLSFPKPFECEFQVRSETLRRLTEEGTEFIEQ